MWNVVNYVRSIAKKTVGAPKRGFPTRTLVSWDWEFLSRRLLGQRVGRIWNFTSLLVFPLPPSAWNGARVEVRRVDALALPAAVRVVDPAVESFPRDPIGYGTRIVTIFPLTSASSPSERLPVAIGTSLPTPSMGRSDRRSCMTPSRRSRSRPRPCSSARGVDRAPTLPGSADRSPSVGSARRCTCSGCSLRGVR